MHLKKSKKRKEAGIELSLLCYFNINYSLKIHHRMLNIFQLHISKQEAGKTANRTWKELISNAQQVISPKV